MHAWGIMSAKDTIDIKDTIDTNETRDTTDTKDTGDTKDTIDTKDTGDTKDTVGRLSGRLKVPGTEISNSVVNFKSLDRKK